MKRTLLALAVLTAAASAQADNRQGFYVGGAVNRVDTNVSSGDGGFIGMNTVEILGGYKYRWFLGGELRIGAGVSGDEGAAGTEGGGTVLANYDISHLASGYYRVESANQTAKLYGLLGLSFVNLDQEAVVSGASISNSHSGLSYGAGIGFVVNPRVNLNFELRQLIESSDLSFEAVTMNFDFRF